MIINREPSRIPISIFDVKSICTVESTVYCLYSSLGCRLILSEAALGSAGDGWPGRAGEPRSLLHLRRRRLEVSRW